LKFTARRLEVWAIRLRQCLSIFFVPVFSECFGFGLFIPLIRVFKWCISPIPLRGCCRGLRWLSFIISLKENLNAVLRIDIDKKQAPLFEKQSLFCIILRQGAGVNLL
jgi:hypothetical protein